MNVKLPDGTILTNVPDGMTKQDILGRLQLAKHPAAEALQRQMAAEMTANESTDMEKFNAGAGLAFQNIVRATKQLFGRDYDRSNAQTDRELLKTKSGLAGNVMGNIAAFSPIAVVPGANTVAGAAAAGATVGGLQPTEESGVGGVKERFTNMAKGGALGAGTQFATGTAPQLMANRASRKATEAAALKSQNAVRDATLKEAQDAGYVIPPSAVNPSWMNKRLESISGKAAVGQEAAYRNQKATNALARKEIGLPDDAAISEAAIKGVRTNAAAPYREIASLNKQAASDLEALKQARFDSNAYYKHYAVSADPKSLAEAIRMKQQAEALEQSIETAAAQSNKPQLVSALREARKQIAKTWEVERALNVATGDVSAKVLGRALDKGKPLSGGLETAAKFAEAFPAYARDGASIPTPGVSKSEALASALFGTLGYGATGNPLGMAAAALPLASGPARGAVLSSPYQAAMATPKYPGAPISSALSKALPKGRTLSRALVPGLMAISPNE